MKEFMKTLGEMLAKFAYPAVSPALEETIRDGGADAGDAIVKAVNSTETPWDNEAARKLAIGLRAAADAIDAGLGPGATA